MKNRLVLSALLSVGVASAALSQDADTSFFIASENPGQGADLGGLEDAALDTAIAKFGAPAITAPGPA